MLTDLSQMLMRLADGRMNPTAGTFLVVALMVTAAAWYLWSSTARSGNVRRPHIALLVKRKPEPPDPTEVERQRTLAYDGSDDGWWHWDMQTDTVVFSPSWAAMLGLQVEDIGNTPEAWFGLVNRYYVSGLRQDLAAHLNGKTEQFESRYRIRHRDGTYRWVLCRGRATRNTEGRALQIAGTQTDVTRLIDVEQRLIHDAFHDRLTGLPNRNSFLASLDRAVEISRQNSHYRFAVLFLDLDGFKAINDSLGHLVGDQLLASVSSRLRGCHRPGDLLARFGGDEFVLLLDDLGDFSVAASIAERVQQELGSPFLLEGHEVTTRASVGIVLSNTKFESAEELLRNADIAMYSAKAKGKGQVRFFTPDMYERTLKSWNLDNDLQNALQRDELLVQYQPLVSLSTGRICGAEALVRWKRSNGEIVSPAEFIPRAEESNLILDIGEWVLRTACLQARQWSQPEMPPLTMSVNLSGRQLSRVDFLDMVLGTLADTGLHPSQLELELTETILMDSSRAAKAALDGLSREGIKLSIDDFGTGYSSLGYLRKFSFDTLKLDQTFVTDVHTDRNAAALTRGLIALAHDLDLRVTAEGVEEMEQLRFLAEHGCDTVQGYLACRPISAEEFTKLLFRQATLLPSVVPASLLEAKASEQLPQQPSMDPRRGAKSSRRAAKDPRMPDGERTRLTLVS